MILVIAEKLSVAQSIAKVLGATSRMDSYGHSYNLQFTCLTCGLFLSSLHFYMMNI